MLPHTAVIPHATLRMTENFSLWLYVLVFEYVYECTRNVLPQSYLSVGMLYTYTGVSFTVGICSFCDITHTSCTCTSYMYCWNKLTSSFCMQLHVLRAGLHVNSLLVVFWKQPIKLWKTLCHCLKAFRTNYVTFATSELALKLSE